MHLYGHYDCGGTHKNPDRRGRLPPTVSVAGFLSTYPQIYEHDRLWRARLKKDKFAYFHMSSFMANKGIFEKCVRWSEKRKSMFLDDLISIIARNATFGIGMAVHRADYEKVWNEAQESVHNALGSPYAFCAFRCFESGADFSIKAKSPDPINYVFEQGDQYAEQIFETHQFLCEFEPLRRRYWLGSLRFDPKNNTLLQAADLLTWELNREHYRQSYPEPEYAYSRDTLVKLMESVPGDYRGYHEDDFRGYLTDMMTRAKSKGKKGKFFIINVPAKLSQQIAEEMEKRSEAKDRVRKVRRNNARTASPSAKRVTKGTGKQRASKGGRKKAAN